MWQQELKPPAVILVVDDDPVALTTTSRLLKSHYRVRVARSADAAMTQVSSEPLPDLILLDVGLPDVSGYELCRALKRFPSCDDIPIIFLSGHAQEIDAQQGFEVGGVDYITKPYSPALLAARIATHLALKRSRDQLSGRADALTQQLLQRSQALSETQTAAIMALASLAESRDVDTGNHIRRTKSYVACLSEAAKVSSHFRGQLSDEQVELITRSAPLHDIGKIGIPDRILLKAGKLDAAEFEIMKSHTTIGRDALLRAEAQLSSNDARFLSIGREVAYAHHERWDGRGYPEGVSGSMIPLAARLMAVADVYDAIISRRVYKDASSFDEAYICTSSGSHFDPEVVSIFSKLKHQFETIAQRFTDTRVDSEQ